MAAPFILLDDARTAEGVARLYAGAEEIVVAHRPDAVRPALARLRTLHGAGRHLAGAIAYEAGLALEPRLAPLAARRTGASGPLVWFGAFAGFTAIADVPRWLSGQADTGAPPSIGPLRPQLSRGGYGAAFDRLVAAIAAGDIYQTNLTFPLAGAWRGDPLALYAALRRTAGAGHGGIVHDGTHWLLSFSPELFVTIADGIVTARPMKGTRPRGRDAAEDAMLRDDLAGSAKDRAENLMIVDLTRNDLSRIAIPGTVAVDAPFAIESYPTVHQMVTTVTARLRPGLDAIDTLAALFPCGSVTGAPKIRAMELIAEVERDARGAYCGAIGRIDPPGTGAAGSGAGDASFNVAIRTLRLTPDGMGAGTDMGAGAGGGRATLGVGSAIVADSQADAEWRECLVKGGFVATASAWEAGGQSVAGCDLIETMRVEGGRALLLELHLDRLAASARTLGFVFDRDGTAGAIAALCAGRTAPGRLRLMVARGGARTLDLGDPPPPLADPAVCAVLRLPVDPGDWRLRHKTSDRGFYAAALAIAQRAGADEALLLRDDGRLTEGSFTSLFVERDGRLLTPPATLGLLPGVLRRSLIEHGKAIEADLTADDLATGFLIGNALRGLVPARLLAADPNA